MRAGIERLQKRIEEVKAFDPHSVTDKYHAPEVDKIVASIQDALARTFGTESAEYDRYQEAANFDKGFSPFGPSDLGEVKRHLAQSQERSLALLNQAVESLQERLAEAGSATTADTVTLEKTFSRRVFVVHGHDDGPRESVARFLDRLGFEAIILHEQASGGRTIIEKVEHYGDVGFAVVLLTPDDEGCKKGGTPAPRARQNVVLELGYFIGRLGRDRVCALKCGDIEVPSDFGSVVYVPFDGNGGWREALGKELDAAGFAIDWNKVMRP
jgi:predicted nucleotide-binding protein